MFGTRIRVATKTSGGICRRRKKQFIKLLRTCYSFTNYSFTGSTYVHWQDINNAGLRRQDDHRPLIIFVENCELPCCFLLKAEMRKRSA